MNDIKGDWEIMEDEWEYIITDRAGHTICSMPRLNDLRANANLIAAAPDMYEALKSLAKMREMLKLYEGSYKKLAEVIGVKSVEELIDLTISEGLTKAEGKEVK